MEHVLMHGPSFDGSGKIVEREVPVGDVKAYQAAGYVEGAMPMMEKPAPKVEEVEVAEEAPKKEKKGKK
jgi:hypothetical protein